MALIPEDRKTEGLMLPMSVRENLSFAAFDRIGRFGVVDRRREASLVDEMVALLAIRAASPDMPAGALSGGNQQKVVIAKWLMSNPRIILLNDPTRGIDVGTKQEIYQLLRRLADAGAAIVFYTTDYSELIGCCDRALVLYDGAIRRELVGDAITERALVASALAIGEPAEGPAIGRGGRMNDWRYVLARNRPTLIAFAFFVAMFALYASNHPAGFSANVVQTAANKGVLLALVAMAQTCAVITAGIDLSVGAVFVLSNCLASAIVVGTAVLRRRGRGGGACRRSGLRRAERPDRHRRPPAADRHDHRDRRDVLRPRPDPPANARRRRLRAARRRPDRARLRRRAGKPRCARRQSFSSSGFPTHARRSAGRPTPSARPSRRPICRGFRSRGRNSSPMCWRA